MDTNIKQIGTIEMCDKEKQALEDYINSLDSERKTRARAFQWRLNQDLRHYKDPVARMNKMVEIFWKGVYKFEVALHEFKSK